MAIYGMSQSEGDLYVAGRDEDGEEIVKRGEPYWYIYDLERQGYRSYIVETFETQAEQVAAFIRLTWVPTCAQCGGKVTESCERFECEGGRVQ